MKSLIKKSITFALIIPLLSLSTCDDSEDDPVIPIALDNRSTDEVLLQSAFVFYNDNQDFELSMSNIEAINVVEENSRDSELITNILVLPNERKTVGRFEKTSLTDSLDRNEYIHLFIFNIDSLYELEWETIKQTGRGSYRYTFTSLEEIEANGYGLIYPK